MAVCGQNKKNSRLKFWPICCTTSCGCASFVILAIAIGIAVGGIFIFLNQRFFANRYLAPDETRLVSVPEYLCQSVSLSAGSETTVYLIDRVPPLSVYRPVIVNTPFLTNLRYRYLLFHSFLQPNSIITVRACRPGFTTYNMHIFRTLTNLNSFVRNPATVTTYSLISRIITQSCGAGNLFYNDTNGKSTDVYAVAFVPIVISSTATFEANVTVLFNRTAYSLDFAKNSIRQYSNCSSFSPASPCQLDVPMDSTSHALVVAAEPPNWDNITNVPVTLQCNPRSSSFVTFTLVPIIGLVLVFIAIGIFFNMCCPRCRKKGGEFGLESGSDHSDDIQMVVPEGIRPYVPHEEEFELELL